MKILQPQTQVFEQRPLLALYRQRFSCVNPSLQAHHGRRKRQACAGTGRGNISMPWLVPAGPAIVAAAAAASAAMLLALPQQCAASSGVRGMPMQPTTGDEFMSMREWRSARNNSKNQQPDADGVQFSEAPPVSKLTIPQQVADIQDLTRQAEAASATEDYDQALNLYTQIVERYPELAITDYSRISRALMLFQTGQRSRAILELEDLNFTFKGSTELAAALAACLHSERPGLTQLSENEWRIVDSFDRRYYNIEWVKSEKHWPPEMLLALQKFLDLS